MKWKVHVALTIVSLLYAIVFIIAKEVMPFYVQPFGLIFLRVSMATFLLWGFHSLFIREQVQKTDFKRLVLCSIFGIAINMLMFFKGLSLTTPINGAVIMVITPILVTVMSLIVLKDQFKVSHWIGLLLGFSGALLLMGGQSFTFKLENLWGDFLVFVNAVSYSFYLVLVKPLTHKYHPVTILKWVFLFGLVWIAPFCYTELTTISWHTLPTITLIEIVYLGVGATFFTYLLNGWAMKKANPSLVGFYIYLQPILTAIIAIALQKDELSLQKVMAALMIFVGVYLVNQNHTKTKSILQPIEPIAQPSSSPEKL